MPDNNSIGWGISGDQAYQQSELNDQQMAMNNISIGNAQEAQAKQQADDALDQQARQMMSKIALGQPVPAADTDGSNNTATSMGSAFMQVAQKMQQLGAPDLAMKYYKSAATIGKNESDLQTQQAKSQQTAAETLLKQSDILGRTLGSATSQDEWNQGMQQLQNSGAFTPQQLQTFQQIPYHPASAQHIADSAISVKDKAQLSMTQAGQQLTQNRDAMNANYKQASLEIQRQRVDDAERVRATNVKTGKAATAPTGPQVNSVQAAIVNQIFQGQAPADKDALKAGAEDIASRAQVLVQGNKGLDWQTAVNRAVSESQNAGDWDIHKGSWYNPSDDDSVKFNGQGKTPDDALALPVTDNKVDPSSLKKGRWYITVKGRGQWDGTNFNVPN